jgi:hypothetical protein
MSLSVHALLSSQASELLSWMHWPAEQESVVHGLLSVQVIGLPA